MSNELELHAPDTIKDVSHVQHVDFASDSKTYSKERTGNFFLLLTCAAFGSASLVFGFDDKIISPVAALAPFVSVNEPFVKQRHRNGSFGLTA